MLTQLAIHRIGVIDEAILDFGPGFTALTGETGAGKTMVVTGLGLLMGKRLDGRRAGVSSMVEGRVQVGQARSLASTLDALGAESDDGEVLIVRKVTKDGRSRAHVGGVPVPVSTLAEVVGSDITIHGQSDQIRVKDPERQRAALDLVLSADDADVVLTHASQFAARSARAAEAAALAERLQDREARRAHLTAVLEKIEAAHTFDGEDDQLRAEIDQLSRAAEDAEVLDTALMALVGDEQTSLMAAADRTAAALGALTEPDEPSVRPSLVDRVLALREETSDIAREITLRREDSLASPGRLADAQERLHDLSSLLRELGPYLNEPGSITDLLAESATALRALEELDSGTERLAQLRAEIADLDASLDETARLLTAARTRAATRLAEAIEKELAGLEMPGAHMRITVGRTPMGAHGCDSVTFELQPHPGADFMPVAQGASGGELSRIMLALEVSIAALGPQGSSAAHPVFIFDEIDAGIGGRAARAVGERLAQLSRSAQVIVVTHLPQVAACAETHLQIVKSVGEDGETTSRIHPLKGEDRVKELARMLAGDEDSSTALAHARELLAASAHREEVRN